MNISGVLVRARPERFPDVLNALQQIAGLEIHQTDVDAGRIVLTLEDGPGHSVEESLLKVHLVEGLSDAALVYQYADGEETRDASAPHPNLPVLTQEKTP